MPPRQGHQDNRSMQPPPAPPINIPVDPALGIYPSYYPYQQPQQHHQRMPPPHLMLAPNASSPSSQGSESMGTPPMDQISYHAPNANGKRPSSSLVGGGGGDTRKRSRKEDEEDSPRSVTADRDEGKPKPTRGSR